MSEAPIRDFEPFLTAEDIEAFQLDLVEAKRDALEELVGKMGVQSQVTIDRNNN